MIPTSQINDLVCRSVFVNGKLRKMFNEIYSIRHFMLTSTIFTYFWVTYNIQNSYVPLFFLTIM